MTAESSSDRERSGLGGEWQPGDNGEGSIFSRNLQLDFNEPRSGGSPPGGAGAGGEMPAGQRRTYFRLEAGKTVEILGEELERFGGEESAPELVRELWESWQALWGGSDEPAVVRFTGAFRTVVEAFAAAGSRGQPELDPPERMALDRLLQAMGRVARSDDESEVLEACREEANRVRRMLTAWRAVDEKGGGPDSSPDRPEEAAGPGGEEDVGGSIDEWFSQVSRFISRTPDGASEPAEGQVPGEEEPDRQDAPAQQEPAGESPPPPVEAVETQAGAEPVEGDRLEPEDSTEREIPGGPDSEGWLAEVYFFECCQQAMETVRNNMDRLEGRSAGRTAAMLAGRVRFLLELADDFALPAFCGELEALRARLESISAGETAERDTAIDSLLGAVSRLERECGRALCAGA